MKKVPVKPAPEKEVEKVVPLKMEGAKTLLYETRIRMAPVKDRGLILEDGLVSVSITNPSGPADPVAHNPVSASATVMPTTAYVSAWLIDYNGVRTGGTPPAPGVGGNWTFNFPAVPVGYYLLTVRAVSGTTTVTQTLPIQVE